jgi:hypothetical protein
MGPASAGLLFEIPAMVYVHHLTQVWATFNEQRGTADGLLEL